MILKQVIHYPDTNSVEATWVEIITPADVVPESIAPDTTDKDGNTILGAVTPAHIIPAVERQVRCHSYSDAQMGILRADLGADIAEYEPLIAEVLANQKPLPVPTAQELQAVVNAQALAYLVSTDWMVVRFAETGMPVSPDVLEARRVARDAIVS